MKQHVTLITLGVNDLKRSFDFYKNKLGWETKSEEKDGVAFFKTGGVILALYPRHLLAEDASVDSYSLGFPGFSLAHNVESEEEVRKVLEDAERAGAKILKKAQKAFWGGYTGYFADPDGFLWEVAYNPHWKLNPDGTANLP